MGEVYEAVEEPLARGVAVKTIRRSQSASAISLLGFDRERRTLARLHHTNNVPILATGCEGELLYFAMPYLSGASLGQVIKTAFSHGSPGSTLSNSSFEALLQEAHSRSQSASQETAPPVAVEPKPAGLGEDQATDVGTPVCPAPSIPAQDPVVPVLSKTYIRTAVAEGGSVIPEPASVISGLTAVLVLAGVYCVRQVHPSARGLEPLAVKSLVAANAIPSRSD
jgi:hypothetical protein